jgi:hypothetical protein
MKRFAIRPLAQHATGVFVAVLLLLGIGIQDATAQFEQKSMDVGELHQVYNESGGNQEFWASGNDFDWPGIYQRGYFRAGALWIGAENVTDENGREYPARVVHVGPRVTGAGVFLPQEFETIQQFEDPSVTVDGLETLDRAADVDQVDPSIPAHRIIRAQVNTLLGVTLEKRILGWGQEHHGNYHIHEYTLTNTGNVDSDGEAELDQPLEDVYLHFQRRWTMSDRASIPGQEWGANVMNDIVGDGMDDYDVDFRAAYTWIGNSPGFDIDPLGGPARDSGPFFIPEGQDEGELSLGVTVGTVTLDATPSTADDADGDPVPPFQPSMTGYIDADDPLTSTNSPFNETQMQDEYRFMSQARENDGPHMFPHHADVVDQDGDFTTADGSPMLEKPGGWTSAFSYGPYDLDIGESATVVIAMAADGLNQQEQVEVGRAFKASDFDPEANIEIDYINARGERINPDVQQGKNDWAVTATRDSLFATFERAIANYESGYNIPLPPPPPTSFSVTSGVGEISLEWTADSDPPGGFEIYRSANDVRGDWRSVNQSEGGVNFGAYQYERIAELDGSARSFTDNTAQRGINYYYYILSVGDVNNDGTGLTPTGKPLRSSRYWTQTYNPASLARPPGDAVSDFKIVPNPYNLGSDPEIRFPDDDEKLGFLDIPGNSVIRIYTELGELVQTIRHDDGSGDEFWNLATDDRQLVVSGVYIAVVEDLETGDQSTKKFVIIR